jgi:hypothetical protein
MTRIAAAGGLAEQSRLALAIEVEQALRSPATATCPRLAIRSVAERSSVSGRRPWEGVRRQYASIDQSRLDGMGGRELSASMDTVSATAQGDTIIELPEP